MLEFSALKVGPNVYTEDSEQAYLHKRDARETSACHARLHLRFGLKLA